MPATAVPDGITTRDTEAPYPIPIATSRTVLMAEEAVSVRTNAPPILEISGRRAPRVVPAGCKEILAATDQGDAAGRANCHRTRALPTGLEEVVARASFQRIRVRTGQVADRPDQSVRRTGVLQAARLAEGAHPKRPRATGEVHSAEEALRRAVSSATVELAAWAAAALAAAGAGVDTFPKGEETKEQDYAKSITVCELNAANRGYRVAGLDSASWAAHFRHTAPSRSRIAGRRRSERCIHIDEHFRPWIR